MDAAPNKKKLADMAIEERYLRVTSEKRHLVLIAESSTTKLVRQEEFLIEIVYAKRTADEENDERVRDYEPFCD